MRDVPPCVHAAGRTSRAERRRRTWRCDSVPIPTARLTPCGFGEFDLAFQHADRALAAAGDDATRTFVMTNAGRPRYMAGHYDWVLTTYLASMPDAPLAHFYRSLAYGAKGLFKEALAEAKAFQAVDTEIRRRAGW